MAEPRFHPIKALPPNPRGHDYLVGDIHAQFSRLRGALDEIGFRPDCDRLIAVGDLIDRGPESSKAAEWLDCEWFHSIRGNHEDLYLGWRELRDNEVEQRIYEREGYRKNGGTWMADVDEPTHARLEMALLRLPYFLLLPVGGRTLGVVHAELPDGFRWPAALSRPFAPEWAVPMTWGRRLWLSWKRQEEHEPWVEGLDALVVGHTPVPGPQVWGNVLFLDTGGWRKKSRFTIVRSDHVLAWVDGRGEPPGPSEPTAGDL